MSNYNININVNPGPAVAGAERAKRGLRDVETQANKTREMVFKSFSAFDRVGMAAQRAADRAVAAQNRQLAATQRAYAQQIAAAERASRAQIQAAQRAAAAHERASQRATALAERQWLAVARAAQREQQAAERAAASKERAAARANAAMERQAAAAQRLAQREAAAAARSAAAAEAARDRVGRAAARVIQQLEREAARELVTQQRTQEQAARAAERAAERHKRAWIEADAAVRRSAQQRAVAQRIQLTRANIGEVDRANREAQTHVDRKAAAARTAEQAAAKAAEEQRRWNQTMFHGTIAAGMLFLAVKKIANVADAYTNIRNRLSAVTKSESELQAVMNTTYGIAQRSRAGWEETNEIYVRIRQSTQDLGVSAYDAARATETLSKITAISGARTSEANAALIQLSQAMASGTLRGDELRSIMEQLPMVADVIARSLGKTRAEFYTMGRQGKISTQIVMDALKNSAGEIDARFAKTVPTIAQSVIALKNVFTKAFGEMLHNSGVVKKFAEAVAFLQRHSSALVKTIELLAKVILGVLVGGAILGAVAAFRALQVAMSAHPFFAIMTAAVALQGVLPDLVNALRPLGDMFEWIEEKINSVSGPLAKIYGLAKDAAGYALGGVGYGASKTIAAKAAELKNIKDLTKPQEWFIRSGDELGEFGFDTSTSSGRAQALMLWRAGQEMFQLAAEEGASYAKTMATVAETLKLSKGFVMSQFEQGAFDVDGARPQLQPDAKSGGGGSPKEPKDTLKQDQAAWRSLVETLYPVQQAYNQLADAEDTLDMAIRRGWATTQDKQILMERQKELLHEQLHPMDAMLEAMQKEQQLLALDEKARQRAVRMEEVRNTIKAQGLQVSEAGMERMQREINMLAIAERKAEARNRQIELERSMYEEVVGPLNTYMSNIAALERLWAAGKISLDQLNAGLEQQRENFDGIAGSTSRIKGFEEQLRVASGDEYRRDLTALNEMFKAGDGGPRTFDLEESRAYLYLLNQINEKHREYLDSIKGPPDQWKMFGESLREELLKTANAFTVLRDVFDTMFSAMSTVISNFIMSTDTDFKELARSLMQTITDLLVRMLLARLILSAFGGNVANLGGMMPGVGGGAGIIPSALGGIPKATGGAMRVIGHGGTDSQAIALRTTPGEVISVSTPSQQRDQAKGTGDIKVKVVNQFDRSAMLDELNSPAGERTIVNILYKKRGMLKKLA